MPNWCTNLLAIDGTADTLDRLGRELADVGSPLSLDRLDPPPRLGHPNDWCTAFWGTKWDLSDVIVDRVADGRLLVSALTAWDPPLAALTTLTSRYDVTVTGVFEELSNGLAAAAHLAGGRIQAEYDLDPLVRQRIWDDGPDGGRYRPLADDDDRDDAEPYLDLDAALEAVDAGDVATDDLLSRLDRQLLAVLDQAGPEGLTGLLASGGVLAPGVAVTDALLSHPDTTAAQLFAYVCAVGVRGHAGLTLRPLAESSDPAARRIWQVAHAAAHTFAVPLLPGMDDPDGRARLARRVYDQIVCGSPEAVQTFVTLAFDGDGDLADILDMTGRVV